MTNINRMFNEAELALAAYADLLSGPLTDQRARLESAGMSEKQAAAFARLYPTVVAQFNDTETSFSATVFKDIDGNLTLAIKGTSEYGDFVPTDTNIFLQGAGYDQIVAMYNWWKRVSTPQGQMVEQYAFHHSLLMIEPVPDEYTFLYHKSGGGSVYLVEADSVAASGELVDDLSADSNQRLSVTGHSLGGHLSMAFGALFKNAIEQVTVFNAPGIRATTDSEAFFTRLGGEFPTGLAAFNVIADEANVGTSPWKAIAGLHGRPGAEIDIAIEDQYDSDEPDPTDAYNHSQQTLTDALAVYAILYRIDPTLSADDFKLILGSSVSGTAASLESIIDTLEELFGLNSDSLATGNKNRDKLYEAIYALEAELLVDPVAHNPQLKSKYQGFSISAIDKQTALEEALGDGEDAKAYRYALIELNPFVITGKDSLYDQHNENDELERDNLSGIYLVDRANMLDIKLNYYGKKDIDYSYDFNSYTIKGDWDYKDLGKLIDNEPLAFTVDGLGEPLFHHQIIFGSEKNEYLSSDIGGKANSDRLYGGAGDDTLRGLAGDDYLEGGNGIDYLYGGDDDDYLEGGKDADILSGGDGQDLLIGGKGEDTLWGGDGIDILMGGPGGDYVQHLYNSTGDDFARVYVSEQSWDGEEKDRLEGGKGDDKYFVGPGDVINDLDGKGAIYLLMKDSEGGDVYALLSGFDRWIKEDDVNPSFDIIHLGLGVTVHYDYNSVGKILTVNNSLTIENYTKGDFFINWGPNASASWANAQLGNSYWYGLDENHEPKAPEDWAATYDPWWYKLGDEDGGTDTNDQVDGTGGDDAIETGDANTTVYAGAGDDVVSGGAGIDQLYGEAGNDTISGGGGSGDLLNGGAGSDTYIFALGDGDTTINNYDTSNGRHDVLRFLSGIEVGDVRISRSNYDLLLTLQTSGETITVTGYFVDEGAGGYALDAIGFADDTSWDIATVLELPLHGSEDSDTIFGDSGNDSISGHGGDDSLVGLAGNDTLSGGDGDDQLFGGEGNDELSGGAGHDQLLGDDGDDQLFGGGGSDALWGGAGDDTLVCDGGQSVGGDGNDTYIHNAGSGDLLISNDDSSSTSSDILIIQGINSSVSQLSCGSQNELEIKYLLNTPMGYVSETITILGYFDQAAGTSQALDSITFSDDGVTWNTDDVRLKVFGTLDSPVTLYSDPAGGELHGGEAGDHLYGAGGDDQLYGEGGDDYIRGSGGNDSLYGGDGDDTLYGNYGINDLYGGAGDDTLESDSGSSSGGDGNDTYIHNARMGDLVISNDDSSVSSNDLLIINGIDSDNVVHRRGTQDELKLTCVYYDTRGHISKMTYITILDFFNPNTTTSQTLDSITFGDDGVTWSLEYIGPAGGELHGGEGYDHIYGSEWSDQLYGEGGNDRINGAAGSDSIWGGEGDDELRGNDGDDQLFGGDGLDELRGGSGNDHIKGGADRDMLYGDDGDDYIDGAAGNDGLYGGDGNDHLVGGDGSDALSGRNGEDTLIGGDGDDWLSGWYGDDTLFGGNGDDYLEGSIGNDYLAGGPGDDELRGYVDTDVLIGGTGNDLLYGYTGDDTYIFYAGDGQDVIDDSLWYLSNYGNHIEYPDLTSDDIMVRRSGDDLVLSNRNNSDQVTVTGQFGVSQLYRKSIYDITFADGVVWSRSDLFELAVSGSVADDNIEGFDTAENIDALDGDDFINAMGGDDVINGGDGWDLIYGGAGYDTIAGDNGRDNIFGEDGNDLLIGGEGWDRLFGGDGNDILNGGSGRDRLNGGAGDDHLSGGSWSDRLSGGDGGDILSGGDHSDRLYGGTGNDVLCGDGGMDRIHGGEGDDQLFGGEGEDYYFYEQGDGADVIDNTGGGVDSLYFVLITTERLSFSREEDDLLVLVDGDLNQSVRVVNHFLGGDFSIDMIQPYTDPTIQASMLPELLDPLPSAAVSTNNQLDQLVSAMASYGAPSGTGCVNPQDERESQQIIVAESWQAVA